MNHMIQLRDAIVAAQIRQPVTFPIRAGLSTSPESQQSIFWLLEQVILLGKFLFNQQTTGTNVISR